MRTIGFLALGLLGLLAGARLWALLTGQRRGGVYFLSGARQVRLLFWPLTALVASLPFVLGVAARAGGLPPLALAGGAVLAAALLSLSLPALVLHARYQQHDGGTVVLFDARAATLEIRRPKHAFIRFAPAQVRAAVYTRPQQGRALWAAYETLRLDFAAPHPASVTLSSAVLDLPPVVAWLRAGGVEIKETRRWLTWI